MLLFADTLNFILSPLPQGVGQIWHTPFEQMSNFSNNGLKTDFFWGGDFELEYNFDTFTRNIVFEKGPWTLLLNKMYGEKALWIVWKL
jgi:hypothetical protein